MFEKEAEEIANKRCHEIMCFGHCSFSSPKHHRCGEWHREYNCAKEGIEFGYNKANEWHYVKDELPDEGTYLVVWQNDKGYKEIFIMNYEEDDEEELHWVDGDCEIQDEYIIAWKELPKFPKESE